MDTETSEWKITLWLDMLDDPEVITLAYDDITHGVADTVANAVQNMSKNSVVFSAEFPFSWYIYSHIEKLLSQVHANRKYERDVQNIYPHYQPL